MLPRGKPQMLAQVSVLYLQHMQNRSTSLPSVPAGPCLLPGSGVLLVPGTLVAHVCLLHSGHPYHRADELIVTKLSITGSCHRIQYEVSTLSKGRIQAL